MYSLNVDEVKNVLDAIMNDKPFDKKAFEHYHLNRNHFNVKNEVNRLEEIGNGKFRDNLGFVWTEVSTLKNFFHMPKMNWMGSVVGISEPYSRKYLRDDNSTGLDGEFEMIIRTSDGKRVDGVTHTEFQETYNFGKTRNTTAHTILDIKPHNANPNYQVKVDTGYVRIIKK